jgi:hypothetical protein
MSRYLNFLLRIGIAALLVAGCGLVPAPVAASRPLAVTNSPQPFPPLTATSPPPSAAPLTSLPPTVTATAPATLTASPTSSAIAKRVLILSIDGLRPEIISLSPMYNLLALMKTSAYTLSAQTIYPSATLPAHASMLLGTCPSQTGVDWNDYDPENGFAQGTSIFALAKQAGLKTVMIVGKKKLRQITPPETTDEYLFINDRDAVVAEQAVPILKTGFDLAFIHFATTDDMGHVHGWLSWEQLSVARRADAALATLLTALDESGQREGTLIIITADHGGHDIEHGTRRPEDMTIPWLLNGPGVIAQTIVEPVNITDTAATAAWALGLTPPSDWVGLPVTEAFGQPPTIRAEPRCP